MDDKKKPNKFKQKHDWVANAMQQQLLIAGFHGRQEYDNVPKTDLRDKLENEYKSIGDSKKPEKWLAVEKRIMKENENHHSFKLKPIFINFVDESSEYNPKQSGLYIIFRVRREKTGTPIYVDHQRTYKDWKDFLKNNTLPKLVLIYPYGGNYTERTELVMEKSAACSARKQLRKGTKIAATSVTLVSTVALAAVPFVPVLAPVAPALFYAAAGGGAFMGIDGAVQITDLLTHNESMSPTNLRALDAYMDVGSACGGLLRGGATFATKFLAEDATKLAKLVRILKIAGSTTQNISLFLKCTTPLLNEFNYQDFKNFCLSFLNLKVEVDYPWAKLFIQLFTSGIAVCRRAVVRTFVIVRSVKDLTAILFTSLLGTLSSFGCHLQELGAYFANLVCYKSRHMLPHLINFEKFALLQQDFLLLIKKASAFFEVSDIFDIKFNGFSLFKSYSISGLKRVQHMMEANLNYINKLNKYPVLTKQLLVNLWLEFMGLIKCCSPQFLIRGTSFFLGELCSFFQNPRNCKKPSPFEMKNWANEFLSETGHCKIKNTGDEPAFPAVNGMEVYIFYSPNVESDRSVFSKKLRSYYREKAEILTQHDVTKENSKFHESSNAENAVLYLSRCHEHRAAVFNRIFLENGNTIILVSVSK